MTWLAKYSRLLKRRNASPDYLNANRRLQHAHIPNGLDPSLNWDVLAATECIQLCVRSCSQGFTTRRRDAVVAS